jgi:hypothetical protein
MDRSNSTAMTSYLTMAANAFATGAAFSVQLLSQQRMVTTKKDIGNK